jgi:hypothetical protein
MIGVITGLDFTDKGAVLFINDKPHRAPALDWPLGWQFGQEVEYELIAEPYKMPVVSNIRPVTKEGTK